MVWSSFVLAKHASFQKQTAHPHLSQYVTRCFPKQLLLYGRDRQHLNKQTDMSASSTSTAPNREWTWQRLWPALGWIYTPRKPSDRLCKNRATVVLMNQCPLQLYASFHDLWCYCSRITEGCANMQDLNQEATNSATSLRSLDHWWNRRRRHPKVTQDLAMLWFQRDHAEPPAHWVHGFGLWFCAEVCSCSSRTVLLRAWLLPSPRRKMMLQHVAAPLGQLWLYHVPETTVNQRSFCFLTRRPHACLDLNQSQRGDFWFSFFPAETRSKSCVEHHLTMIFNVHRIRWWCSG